MQTNQNVGKTTQNLKTASIGHNSKIVTLSVTKKITAKHLKELNLKQGTALLNENRDGLIEFSASVVDGEAKQEGLIEQFFKAGFKAIMLTSPNDKKQGKKGEDQKVIKSKNVYLTVKQWKIFMLTWLRLLLRKYKRLSDYLPRQDLTFSLT